VGKPGWFVAPLHFDDKALAKAKMKREQAEALVSEQISACPGVARVWTRTAIENRGSAVDPVLVQFARSYYPGRSPDLFVQYEEGFIDDPRGTTHGSPYEYDTHVPGIVSWPGIPPRLIGEPIATVDLPVTIAELLGLEAPKDVDGVDRSGLMR
jgi:hypothetical protein